MKKFLALTVVAGSALGIAATTTACNNDQIKSQIELGLNAAYGMESGAKCYDTFTKATDTADTGSIVSIAECVTSNTGIIADKTKLPKKIEFSNYKLVDNKDLTANASITIKITPREATDAHTIDFTVVMSKVDGSSTWTIDKATGVAKA